MADALRRSSSTTETSFAPISRLPNEVLSKIFSYLPDTPDERSINDEFEVYGETPPLKFPASQPVVSIRQVCRRLRAVANELQFWYDSDFELSQLCRSPFHADVFLEALLSDDHLTRCLGKRTKWTFGSFGSL